MALGKLTQAAGQDTVFQRVFKGSVDHDMVNDGNLNALDTNDRSLLHWACSGKNHAMIQYLLNLGIKVTLDDSGLSPLMISALVGDLKGCEYVLPHCDLNAADIKGKTSVHSVCSKGYDEIFDFLTKNGALLDKQDILGQTPLFRACMNGNIKIVKRLVEGGARINHTDGNKDTPLHLCVEMEHGMIAVYLIQNGALYDVVNKDGKTAFQMTANLKLLEFVAKEID